MQHSKSGQRVAVITGGGRGIGRAAALLLASKGFAVVAAARTPEEVEETARQIQEQGGQAAAVVADVSSWPQTQRLAQEAESRFGPVDALVVNAGVVGPFGMSWEADPEDWARNIQINLTGAYLTVRAFLPTMVQRRKGAIILISSGAATRPISGLSAYSSAKAGLEHFMNNLWAELTEKEIPLQIFSFRPGVVDTAMQANMRQTPATSFPSAPHYRTYYETGRLRSPEEPAQVIYWLTTPGAASLSGQVISIDDAQIRKQVAADLGVEPLRGR